MPSASKSDSGPSDNVTRDVTASSLPSLFSPTDSWECPLCGTGGWRLDPCCRRDPDRIGLRRRLEVWLALADGVQVHAVQAGLHPFAGNDRIPSPRFRSSTSVSSAAPVTPVP